VCVHLCTGSQCPQIDPGLTTYHLASVEVTTPALAVGLLDKAFDTHRGVGGRKQSRRSASRTSRRTTGRQRKSLGKTLRALRSRLKAGVAAPSGRDYRRTSSRGGRKVKLQGMKGKNKGGGKGKKNK
jgi:hypothetical protein